LPSNVLTVARHGTARACAADPRPPTAAEPLLPDAGWATVA